MNNERIAKTYWAPTQTFLVFVFYIFLGGFILMSAILSTQSFQTFFIYILIIGLLIERVIRFSYRLKIENGKIFELGFLTRNRSISIDKITRIKYKKENFWSGGFAMPVAMGDANWQRQFYIDSPEAILPKYAVNNSIINDLLKMRPDLKVEKGGLTFESPLKINRK